MKKIILIPDSFKGTMSSAEVCAVMAEQLRKHEPQAQIVSIPVADGGEGSVDCFLAACGGEKISAEVSGPFFQPVPAFYGLIDGGKTAVIEMAACAGLPLVGEEKNPERTTTYGVGQLMAAAAARGCRKIIVGLGGSCTNDGGAGAAAAAGVRFFDASGREFVPTGGTLGNIRGIDDSGLLPALREAEIVAMCDIDNPLFGESGAAYVFAPQKGADAAMVKRLDGGLRNFSEAVNRCLGKDISLLPGAGAAGGMGGGMAAFFGSRLLRGIETVLETVRFDETARDADCIFSGEGRFDAQSLRGKVVAGVARHAKKLGVPLVAIVGVIGDGIEAAYDLGVTAVFSTNRAGLSFSELRPRCRSDLALTMDSLLRLKDTFCRNVP